MTECKVCMHLKRKEINNAIMNTKNSYRKISDKYGVSWDSVKRHALNHLGVRRNHKNSILIKNQVRNSAVARFLDLKRKPENVGEHLITGLIEWQEKYCKQLSIRQDEVNIEVKTEEPILSVYISDLHVGAISGKYQELNDVTLMLKDLPNTYCSFVGDSTDNFLPAWHSQGQFEVMFPPELQKEIAIAFLERLNLWCCVNGCHDEASHLTDDFDLTKFLAERFNCADLGFGGLINVHLPGQTYSVRLRHKYRYNSSFNPCHTCNRLREQLGDCDVAVVAHHHQPALEERISLSDGLKRVNVRPGSFKGADRFARSLGFTDVPAKYAIPSVMLFPYERKLLGFLDIRDAVTVLKSYVK